MPPDIRPPGATSQRHPPTHLLLHQGAEKPIISKMLVEHSNRRTFPVDRHAGMAVAGVAADGRAVVGRTQAEARQYKQFYGNPIPGHVLADRVASYVHIFNLYWYVRPMGVTSLLAAYDEQEGPALYCVDPAGNVHVRWFLCEELGVEQSGERVRDRVGGCDGRASSDGSVSTVCRASH